MRTLSYLVLASIVGVAGSARADGKYHPVPGGKAHLRLRVVKYDGEVNGLLTVEVKNPTSRVATFTASGLYFVPDGDPDRAPQRLGAAGPMQIGEQQEDAIRVPAGGKVLVQLDVFCVDDHREAPTSETAFTLARHRMPAALARTIDHQTHAAAKAAGGYASPDNAEPVQAEIWKARDEKWIKLDGEGAQETDKASGHARDHEQRDRTHEERAPEPAVLQP